MTQLKIFLQIDVIVLDSKNSP